MKTKQIFAAVIAAIAMSLQTTARAEIPQVDWETTINHFQIDSDKFVGQRLSVQCPQTHARTQPGQIYGTDIYTSDSAICSAAVHAGALSQNGGAVTLQVAPGAKSYNGSSRHGVTSNSRPETERAIMFIGGGNPDADAVQAHYRQHLDWDTKFTRTGLAHRELIGQQFAFYCPKAPEKLMPRRVVGTDRYAFDSMICRAAVHAGAITTEGGDVVLQMDDGDTRLVGSIRNGIETANGSSGIRTLQFVLPAN